MATFSGRWAIGGGWAADCWLGRQTRPHGDVDVVAFEPDQRALFEHLRGWNLIPHDTREPASRELWDGRHLELPAHVHARPPGPANREFVIRAVTPPFTAANDGHDVEFILNETDGADWLVARDPRIALPLDAAIRDRYGVPLVVPAVLMLYKAAAYWGRNPLVEPMANAPRSRDLRDFAALALLEPPETAWLRQSLGLLHPGHPWLVHLPA
jgi:hypothetical protein